MNHGGFSMKPRVKPLKGKAKVVHDAHVSYKDIERIVLSAQSSIEKYFDGISGANASELLVLAEEDPVAAEEFCKAHPGQIQSAISRFIKHSPALREALVVLESAWNEFIVEQMSNGRQSLFKIEDPTKHPKVSHLSINDVKGHLSPDSLDAFNAYMSTIPTAPPTSLASFSYAYDSAGELKNTIDGSGFHFVSQQHYEDVGDFVLKEIQRQMVEDLGMNRVTLPVDAKPPEPTLDIFMTPDALSNPEKLLLLIQGTGAVRPGQWARALCINDGLRYGSKIPYIRRAMSEGYGVIVFNPNQRGAEDDPAKASLDAIAHKAEETTAESGTSASPDSDPLNLVGKQVRVYWPRYRRYYIADVESYDAATGQHFVKYGDGDERSYDFVNSISSKTGAKIIWSAIEPPKPVYKDFEYYTGPQPRKTASKIRTRPVRGSTTPSSHGIYVFDTFVKDASAAKLAIVAHSAGGAVTHDLLRLRWPLLADRLCCVCFTDAVHTTRPSDPRPVRMFLSTKSTDWQASDEAMNTILPRGYNIIPKRSSGHNKHEWTTGCAEDGVFGFLSEHVDGVAGAGAGIARRRTASSAAQRWGFAGAAGDSGDDIHVTEILRNVRAASTASGVPPVEPVTAPPMPPRPPDLD